ncbi:MAG TPA: hypothetical protein VKB93_21025 [Thermoanaerobaculia bacterium]|nr:hypothetical protein [Thermoanaerobaculia bacterium]
MGVIGNTAYHDLAVCNNRSAGIRILKNVQEKSRIKVRRKKMQPKVIKVQKPKNQSRISF